MSLAPSSDYAKSVHPDRLALQATPDEARRPDPHRLRNAVRHTFPANPMPAPADPAHAGGLVGAVAAGMAECALYAPDAPDYATPAYASDWLSDSGRCELASVPALCERIEREAPGVAVRVAVSFAVSRLPCGTVHFDRRPAWELTAWRGTEAFNESGFDLEQLAARAAAKFMAEVKAAGKDGGR